MLKNMFIAVGLCCFVGNAFPGLDAPCKTIKLAASTQHILLNTDDIKARGKLFFMQNISGHDVWINHPKTTGSANAGWASFLRNRYWSALFLTQTNFALSCGQSLNGKILSLNCPQVLRACNITYYAKGKKGNYWVTQNKEYSMLVPAVKARGFKMKDSGNCRCRITANYKD